MNRVNGKKQNPNFRRPRVSDRIEFRALRTALLFLSVGAASLAFSPTTFADCWPPLNAIEERGTQTTIMGGVPFTTGFHSWHVPHYHVDNLHCEESISRRSYQWSFVFGAENSKAQWLLKTPVHAGSTLGRTQHDATKSTPFAPLPGLQSVDSLSKNLTSLQPAPTLAPLTAPFHSLPELPSLSSR